MPRPIKPPIPLWQKPINGFFGGNPSLHAEKQLFEIKLKAFRAQYERSNPSHVYLGRKGKFCYYRDTEFYEYYAYDPQTGRKVGELSLDDEHFLTGIYVEVPYQRRGIGTALINFANITNMSAKGSRLIISIGQEYNSRYRLTHEAMQLANACVTKGILDHDQLLNASIGSLDF